VKSKEIGIALQLEKENKNSANLIVHTSAQSIQPFHIFVFGIRLNGYMEDKFAA